MSISNAKLGGLLIQSTSLVQFMIVPYVQYVCKRFLMIHINSICVHNHPPECSNYMIIQPLYIHFTKYIHIYAICNTK